MDKTKTNRLKKLLLLIIAVLFPLGQLIRLEVLGNINYFIVQPIDVVVGLYLIVSVLAGKKNIGAQFVFTILGLTLFTQLFSLSYLRLDQSVKGLFYLLRLIAYLTFPLILFEDLKNRIFKKRFILKAVKIDLIIIMMLGWIQYFFRPDLRYLKNYGWDDHLFRLVGTFLDPGFTGIILTLGSILFLGLYFNKKNTYDLIVYILFGLTVIFTYSRASYLAMLFSGLYLFKKAKQMKSFYKILILFIGVILFLPRPIGEGVRLERIFSINQRLENYKHTLDIWKKSPLFGIGYNNLCWAKNIYLSDNIIISHSCSGSDSSILMILATTGIIGFMITGNQLLRLYRNILPNDFSLIVKASLIAVFIHSVWVNSMVYPWVLIILGLYLVLNQIPFNQNAND